MVINKKPFTALNSLSLVYFTVIPSADEEIDKAEAEDEKGERER